MHQIMSKSSFSTVAYHISNQNMYLTAISWAIQFVVIYRLDPNSKLKKIKIMNQREPKPTLFSIVKAWTKLVERVLYLGRPGNSGSACQRGWQKVLDFAESLGGFKLSVRIVT